MHGSPNNLRITWQFFDKDFLAVDAFKTPRDFHTFDEKYFDHFNLRVSKVGDRGQGDRVLAKVGCWVLALCRYSDRVAVVVLCHFQDTGAPLVEKAVNRPFDLWRQEDTRPSVMLLSHAAAYAAWYEVRQ